MALVALSAPAPAAAAPLAELPFEALPDAGVATCLRATGAPGELTLHRTLGRRSGALDLRAVDGGAAPAAERVAFGALLECPGTDAAADGSAVTAAAAGRRGAVRMAVRQAGGGFGALEARGRRAAGVRVAAAPGGHTVVAWLEVGAGGERTRVVAARRAPGGAFGPAGPLTPWRRADGYSLHSVAAGVDAAGAATVAWTSEKRRGRRSWPRTHLTAATAPAGGAFAVRRLGRSRDYGGPVVLDVAPDGWALLAHEDADGIRVLERAAGAAAFTPVALDFRVRAAGHPGRRPPGRRLRWSLRRGAG